MNQHKLQEQILTICKLRLPVYAHGPTGCGKTYMMKLIAKELNLPFYKKLVGAQMTEASLLGYNDAHGKYNEGICFKPYTEGGLLVLDEIDNGNANTNLVVNGLCDEELAFPIGMKNRHKDFVIVATANTTGQGATLEYVGRNRLDAAMLNRFVFIKMDYDYELERSLATRAFRDTLNRDLDEDEIEILNQSLVDFWLLRKIVDELEIKHIISQRNLIQQSIMLAAGISGNIIRDTVVLRNLDVDIKNKILNNAKKVSVDAFKQQLATKNEKDLITDEHHKRILHDVEKEVKQLLSNKINELENKIRYTELEIIKTKKFNESQKIGEVKIKLEEKEKELRSLQDEKGVILNKKIIIENKKQLGSIKNKIPNWDDIITGKDTKNLM